MEYLIVIFTGFLYFVHKGIVDFKMYSDDVGEEQIRSRYWYLLTDFTYLTMTAVMFFVVAYVSFFAEMTLMNFSLCLAIGTLFGSEGWDLLFSKTLHGDWMYVIPNWAFGWGFKSKKKRILFDGCRVGLAIILSLLLSCNI